MDVDFMSLPFQVTEFHLQQPIVIMTELKVLKAVKAVYEDFSGRSWQLPKSMFNNGQIHFAIGVNHIRSCAYKWQDFRTSRYVYRSVFTTSTFVVLCLVIFSCSTIIMEYIERTVPVFVFLVNFLSYLVNRVIL